MRVIYDAIRRESGFESIVKSGCSLTVVVLTLLGLAEVGPSAFFVAIATIVFGVRLSLDPVLARDSVSGGSVGAVSGGCPTVLLAGVAGILLGTLALLGASSIQLVALAAIAFGRSIMISSNGGMRMRTLTATRTNAEPRFAWIDRQMKIDAADLQPIAGLAAIVLGILALSGFASTTLVLIALLELGCFVSVSSAIIRRTFARAFRIAPRP
jgi:hypothetical protein